MIRIVWEKIIFRQDNIEARILNNIKKLNAEILKKDKYIMTKLYLSYSSKMISHTKKFNVIFHTNRLKEKNSMLISLAVEKYLIKFNIHLRLKTEKLFLANLK